MLPNILYKDTRISNVKGIVLLCIGIPMEQHIIGTNAGKQQSLAATDV